jgi:ribonucleoside-diphosphate reductase subunit M1
LADGERLASHIHRNYYRDGTAWDRYRSLADVFTAAGFAFDSEEAFEMERGIFRVHATMMESAQLAAEFEAYESHDGSPLSQGILQPDMWGDYARRLRYVTLEDWDDLRKMVAEHGARNSSLVALMPTATTSIIMDPRARRWSLF